MRYPLLNAIVDPRCINLCYDLKVKKQWMRDQIRSDTLPIRHNICSFEDCQCVWRSICYWWWGVWSDHTALAFKVVWMKKNQTSYVACTEHSDWTLQKLNVDNCTPLWLQIVQNLGLNEFLLIEEIAILLGNNVTNCVIQIDETTFIAKSEALRTINYRNRRGPHMTN